MAFGDITLKNEAQNKIKQLKLNKDELSNINVNKEQIIDKGSIFLNNVMNESAILQDLFSEGQTRDFSEFGNDANIFTDDSTEQYKVDDNVEKFDIGTETYIDDLVQDIDNILGSDDEASVNLLNDKTTATSTSVSFNTAPKSTSVSFNTSPKINNESTSVLKDTSLVGSSSNASSTSVITETLAKLPAKKADINGKIEDSKQGTTGDCWLVSGINSLSYTEKGQKIISDAITKNDNGSYTVNLKGAGVSYTFTDAEIVNADNGKFSTGDDDVLLIEMAYDKCLKDVKDGKVVLPNGAPEVIHDEDKVKIDEETGEEIQPKDPINGGFLRDMVYLLTGKNSVMQENKDASIKDFFTGNTFDGALNKIERNPGDYASELYFYGEKGHVGDVTMKDINGDDVVLLHNDGGHAWSLKSVNGNTVTMVNPWDSTKEVVVTRDELRKHAGTIDYCKL